jgi:hypothetical protein
VRAWRTTVRRYSKRNQPVHSAERPLIARSVHALSRPDALTDILWRLRRFSRPRTAPTTGRQRLMTCPNDVERPRCQEFASRGSRWLGNPVGWQRLPSWRCCPRLPGSGVQQHVPAHGHRRNRQVPKRPRPGGREAPARAGHGGTWGLPPSHVWPGRTSAGVPPSLSGVVPLRTLA